MKKVTRVGLIGFWILLMSLCLTYWLINNSAGMIPNPPEAFWLWILDILDAHNRKADVVILVGFIISIPIVSVLTLFGWLFWRKIKVR